MTSTDNSPKPDTEPAHHPENGTGEKSRPPRRRRRPQSDGKAPAQKKKANTAKNGRAKPGRPGDKNRRRGHPPVQDIPAKSVESPPVTGIGDFDISLTSESFRSLDLVPELLRGVHEMGFTEPTPIQKKAIPAAFEGHDIIGCAQTGTGKTAAFALPSLQKMLGGTGTRVLALTPTRELAIQVAEQFEDLGKFLTTRIALVYGGVDYEPQFRALTEGADIVVATPGRLLDHMKRKTADFSRLGILILDEADRMLDMGFAEEINDILKRLPNDRQTMLFSATLPPTIEALSRKALNSPVDVSVSHPSTPADGIFHGVYPLSAMNKPRAVLEILRDPEATIVLVFTRTKAGADRLGDALERTEISVARIHSDRSQRQRERALNGFRRGDHRVLVATDIVARGIDVTDISHVINFDVPEYPEDYVHRAGRTARAGQIGYALTLMSPGEIMLVKNIERFVGKELPRVSLPGLEDDIHQSSPDRDPKPLKDQPPVARYDRKRKLNRRTGLSLR
ncbi:DEAD/DEAH box helicase [Nitrospinota bacterium]